MGACSAFMHVDMFKPWISLASKTLAMRSSKTCLWRCLVIISACHLLGLCKSRSIKVGLLIWHCIASSPCRNSQYDHRCTILHESCQDISKHTISVGSLVSQVEAQPDQKGCAAKQALE